MHATERILAPIAVLGKLVLVRNAEGAGQRQALEVSDHRVITALGESKRRDHWGISMHVVDPRGHHEAICLLVLVRSSADPVISHLSSDNSDITR